MAGLAQSDRVVVGDRVGLAVAVRSLKAAQRGAAALAGFFVTPPPIARPGAMGTLPRLGAYIVAAAPASRSFSVSELANALEDAGVIRAGEWDDVALVGYPGRPHDDGLMERWSQQIYDAVNDTVDGIADAATGIGETAGAIGQSLDQLGDAAEAAADISLIDGLILGAVFYVAGAALGFWSSPLFSGAQ